jgi:hypothetical protein
MSEQHLEAGEVDKAEEVLDVVFPAGPDFAYADGAAAIMAVERPIALNSLW